jgi:ubiquitin-protein ligase
MKRAPKGIRAAVKLQDNLVKQWALPVVGRSVGGGGGIAPLDTAKYIIRKQCTEVEEQYSQDLAIQRKDKASASTYRNIPDGFTLWYTPPQAVDGNVLHQQFKIQVHKADHPDSYWANCQFSFDAVFPGEKYPNEPPKVTCKTRVYHPNIDDASGEVCLSLLKTSLQWKPTVTVHDIMLGIYSLFQDPNGNDYLRTCKEIALLLVTNKEEFKRNARAHAERHKTFIPGSDDHRRY